MNPAAILGAVTKLGDVFSKKETVESANDFAKATENLKDFAKEGGMAALKDTIENVSNIMMSPVMTTFNVVMAQFIAGTADESAEALKQMLELMEKPAIKAFLGSLVDFLEIMLQFNATNLKLLNGFLDTLANLKVPDLGQILKFLFALEHLKLPELPSWMGGGNNSSGNNDSSGMSAMDLLMWFTSPGYQLVNLGSDKK